MRFNSSDMSSATYAIAKNEALSLLARCLAVLGRGEKVGREVRDEVIGSFRRASSGFVVADREAMAKMTDGEIWDKLLELARTLLGDDK